MRRRLITQVAAAVIPITLIAGAALAHITPPVVLVSDRDAVVGLLAGARRFFVREVRLSPEERQHLDRWFLSLLVKLQSLPERQTLTFEKSKQDDAQTRERELQRQQLETQVRDLQQRLLTIRQQADRMTFDLSSARLAASRGDWGGVQTSLIGMESTINQIKQATQ